MPNFKRKIALFVTNHLLVGTRPWSFPLKRAMLNWGGFEIGKNSSVVGPIFVTGRLSVGENTWIGRNFTIHGNGHVMIGNDCDIAPEVAFLTGGHVVGTSERRAGQGQSYIIHVGNGTWIGARSTVMKDVVIGSGCVVASCACVTNSIEDDTLVGGIPAKTIRKLD